MSDSRMKKRCPRCGDRKPIDEFLPDPPTEDGLSEICKECESAFLSDREYTQRDIERAHELIKAGKWQD